MARRSSSSRSRSRGNNSTATPGATRVRRAVPINLRKVTLSRPEGGTFTVRRRAPSNLMPVEDRRRWTPDRTRPLKRIDGSFGVGLEARRPWSLYGFRAPFRVVLCVRRKIRRQVMFAVGGAGSGRKMRRPRRNRFSKVRC